MEKAIRMLTADSEAMLARYDAVTQTCIDYQKLRLGLLKGARASR